MQTTPNYGFKKPTGTDAYNIEDQNGNWDAADTQLKTAADALAAKAPLDSAALTGTPTAPTAAAGTNTPQLATTAFVAATIAALINGAPGALNTLLELADALGDDPNFATSMTNALAAKAPLASPALTGIPTAPTAAAVTNNTQLATTAFVNNAAGVPVTELRIRAYAGVFA